MGFVCLFVFGETLDFDEPYLYQCYIFILFFFKFMKFDCCPLWKLKRKKKISWTLQNLQTFPLRARIALSGDPKLEIRIFSSGYILKIPEVAFL